MTKREPGQLWEVAHDEISTRAASMYYLILGEPERLGGGWHILHGSTVKRWPEDQMENDTLISEPHAQREEG